MLVAIISTLVTAALLSGYSASAIRSGSRWDFMNIEDIYKTFDDRAINYSVGIPNEDYTGNIFTYDDLVSKAP